MRKHDSGQRQKSAAIIAFGFVLEPTNPTAGSVSSQAFNPLEPLGAENSYLINHLRQST
jgi:hypothetical protein